MEMRILADLSHWLLWEPGLRDRLGNSLWLEIFEACGSPTEWQEFLQKQAENPALEVVWDKLDSVCADFEQGKDHTKSKLDCLVPEF